MAEENEVMLDEKEVEQAQEAALAEDRDSFTLKMNPPVMYNGKEYGELNFDYGALTGEDSLAIENELQRQRGITVVEPAYNINYVERYAARACREGVGVDILKSMPIKYYLKIRNKTRDFLIRAGY